MVQVFQPPGESSHVGYSFTLPWFPKRKMRHDPAGNGYIQQLGFAGSLPWEIVWKTPFIFISWKTLAIANVWATKQPCSCCQ